MKEVIITISFIIAVAIALILTKKKPIMLILSTLICFNSFAQENENDYMDDARALWQDSELTDSHNIDTLDKIYSQFDALKSKLTYLVEQEEITINEANLIETLIEIRIAETGKEIAIRAKIEILGTRMAISSSMLSKQANFDMIEQELELLESLDQDLIEEDLIKSIQQKVYIVLALDYVTPLFRHNQIEKINDISLDMLQEILDKRLEEIKNSDWQGKDRLLSRGRWVEQALEDLENEKARLNQVIWQLLK